MAANQLVSFNTQDVADMYRRQQLASMLQDRLSAPVERYNFQGFESPISPLQGLAKGLDAYSVYKNQSNMDEKYAGDKAAAEQKMAAEQDRHKAEVAAYQQGFEPTVGYGQPTGGVTDYAPQGQMVSTPKTRGQLLAHALGGAGSENPQIANIGRMMYEHQNSMAQDESRTAERAQTREDMLSGRAQTQSNADRSYGLDVAKMGQDRNKQPTAPAGYRYKPNGEQEPIPGGPADVKTIKANSAQETGRGTVSSVADQLRNAYGKLNTSKSIINPQNSLMNNLSAGVASSSPGQVASNLVGTEAQSIRNEIKMTRPLLLQQIMKATGMSAKQMDSNAELKLWLSTATDPSVDIKSNLAALDNIEKMYGMPKSATPAPTPSGQGATVSNW